MHFAFAYCAQCNAYFALCARRNKSAVLLLACRTVFLGLHHTCHTKWSRSGYRNASRMHSMNLYSSLFTGFNFQAFKFSINASFFDMSPANLFTVTCHTKWSRSDYYVITVVPVRPFRHAFSLGTFALEA